MSWVTDLVNAITSSLTGIGSALTEFLNTTLTGLFLKTGESGAITGVSNFGIVTFVFFGVSLALSMVYFIVNLCRRKM